MRDLPIEHTIAREITSYFTASMKTELLDLIERQDKLRVSGFPYCALQHAYKKMMGLKETKANAGRDFYTSVGTAAHLVFQRWLGQKGHMWGDWKCYNKQCNHIIRFRKKRKCPKCKSEMEYEEFEVKAFKHLSGHIDGVYEAEDGTFWVIDYKTTSVKTINAQKFNPTFPYAKNKAQIMTYCALLEQKHNIKISGWALLYIARDDPFMCFTTAGTVTEKAKASIVKKCKLYDDQYEVVTNIQTMDDLQYLIDTKPCKTFDFYTEHFKGFKGCPLEAVCFTKKLRRYVKDAFLEYKEQ